MMPRFDLALRFRVQRAQQTGRIHHAEGLAIPNRIRMGAASRNNPRMKTRVVWLRDTLLHPHQCRGSPRARTRSDDNVVNTRWIPIVNRLSQPDCVHFRWFTEKFQIEDNWLGQESKTSIRSMR